MNRFISRFDKQLDKCKIALVAAHDIDSLHTVSIAKRENIADFILVGNEKKIRQIAENAMFDITGLEIIDEADTKKCADISIKLIRDGHADTLMKGIIETSTLMREVLNKETGLRSSSLLSHVTLFILEDGREYIMTDGALNIAPDKETKKRLIENAVEVANAIGYKKPNVACLCAKEHVDIKMPATVDAEYLQEECQRGNIKGCVVSGPLALDNAVSIVSARQKSITDPVAGYANILLVPDIEAGNILYKTLNFLTHSYCGGIIMGASAGIVLTSRADNAETKLNSIILGSLIAKHKKNKEQ